MSAHEAEIAGINHNVTQHFVLQKKQRERLRRQGWCKWTTVKRVRKKMLELLNHPCGDRDRHIHAFIDKYQYHGMVVVTDLELSENSNPVLVKTLDDYCDKELKTLEEALKQKRKDIRRLKTVNRRRVKRGLKPYNHLPTYNRTRDSRNHARNTRRNLRVVQERQSQIQLLNEQEKQSIEDMIDDAFDLKNYLFHLTTPVKKAAFDWSTLGSEKVEVPTGLLKEFLEVVADCGY